MDNILRTVLITIGMVSLILAVGFCSQLPWVVWLWPWADTFSPYLFLGSIAAATAASLLWICFCGSVAIPSKIVDRCLCSYASLSGCLSSCSCWLALASSCRYRTCSPGSLSQRLQHCWAGSSWEPPATSSTAWCTHAGRRRVVSCGRSWHTILCSSSPISCTLQLLVPRNCPVCSSTHWYCCIVELWRSTISLSRRRRERGGKVARLLPPASLAWVMTSGLTRQLIP